MATATTRKRAPKEAAPATVTPDDFVAIEQFLNLRQLVERGPIVRLTTLTMCAGTNLGLLGEPGVAKSLTPREYARSFPDATYYEEGFNEELSANEVIGMPDLARFINGDGKFVRQTEGYASGAHIGFFDERYRANGVLSNSLLGLENASERLLKLNGVRTRMPLRALFHAANYLPDPDNKIAQASVYRVTLLAHVERIQSDANFEELIRRAHDRVSWEAERPLLSLAQLDAAQAMVANVKPTPEFTQAAAKLRRDAYEAGLPVDDRRWIELYRVCRAAAWMNGRDFLVPDDLAACEMGMWREQSQMPKARELVMPFFGRYEQEAEGLRNEAMPNLKLWGELRPEVDNTPAQADVDPETLRKGMIVQRKLRDSYGRVTKLLDEAAREQREAQSGRELRDELHLALEWFRDSLALTF